MTGRLDGKRIAICQGRTLYTLVFPSGETGFGNFHAHWTLINADVLKGRTLTSWPSLQVDIQNAGGNWINQAVVRDNNLVTSRMPSDISEFNPQMIDLFATWHSQA